MIIEGVDKEDLILLEFTKGETLTKLRWEHEKEFEYNAQMYDIVETIVAGNIIYYWCWLDKDETELKRQLGELGNKVFNTDPQKREKNDLLYNFYKSLFFSGRENLHLTLQPVTVKQRSLYCAHTVSSHFQPPTPPPRKS